MGEERVLPHVRQLVAGETVEQPQKHPVVVTGTPTRYWVISPALCSVVVHWNGQRTEPCVMHAHRDECEFCRKGWRAEAQHWLTVTDRPHGDSLPILLKLTQRAVDGCPALEESAGNLWGRCLCVWKFPRHVAGRIFVRLEPDDVAASLPIADDTLVSLHRMWSARSRNPANGGSRPGPQANGG